jgi:hypothetical protein
LKSIIQLSLNPEKIEPLNQLFRALLSKDRTERKNNKIIWNLLEPLQTLGIIDINLQVPGEFIKNAIKKELENETV